MRRLGLLLLLVLSGLYALSGCGGSSDSSSSTSSSQASSTSSSAKQAQAKPTGEAKKSAPAEEREEKAPGPPASAFHPKPHHDSGGGSKQFVVKGGDNSVQEYGEEGSEAELQEAAKALHGFLDARAQRNWAAACSYLSKGVAQSFAELAEAAQKAAEAKGAASPIQGEGCAAAMATLSGKVPDSSLREAAIANVGALRVKGGQAFLIYRGVHGTVAAIQMVEEGGAWKVGSLNGVPLS